MIIVVGERVEGEILERLGHHEMYQGECEEETDEEMKETKSSKILFTTIT